LDEISQERQRISERLARLEAERSKLAEQLSELEAAERVLTRFEGAKGAAPAEKRRRGRPPRPETAAQAAAPRRAHASGAEQGLSLSEAVLKAVEAHPQGIAANELLSYVARRYKLTARPNHLGIALQRHRRAGRLEIRDSRWFSSQQGNPGIMPGEAAPG
jgi:hypothetical protein